MMPGWLMEIIASSKQREAPREERRKRITSLTESIERSKSAGNAIIAEVKRSSPSGFKAEALNVDEYVRYVSEGGASGLSVLTEPKYFGGSYELLRHVSSLSGLPVLMKDFIVSRKQIDAGFALGADAVLLIVRILNDQELQDLYRYAESLGLEALVEVHDEKDVERALSLEPKLIGVNARDLFTLKVSREHQRRILELVPSRYIKVAESGIDSPKAIKELKEAGADAFLIGTALVKNRELLRELIRA